MYRKVFLAGATGAIGSRLMPLLRDAGYEVFGTTRSGGKPLGFKPRASHPLWSTCSMRRRCRERLLRFVRKSSYTNLRTFRPISNQAVWQRASLALRVFASREHGIL